MLKNYYTSGILYHPASQQILLQKQSEDSPWTLIEESEAKGEDFKTLAKKILKLNLSLKGIHFVYDYFHPEVKRNHSVSYAEVDDLVDFPPGSGKVFSWFSHKEILKLKISKLTLQDITVAQRVIDSQTRKDSGERTIG